MSRMSSCSAIHSFPSTMSRTQASRSSSGVTTTIQALEKAVCPAATHHVSVQQGHAPVRQMAFRAQRGPQPAGPRAHHQHVGVDESADLFEH